MKNNSIKKHEPILAFFLSSCIFLGICMMRGIAPFGGRSFLQIDLYHQYAPFHEELRERILAGKSLLYSWEGGLGKEYLIQMFYYTSSPLSLLVLLFPAKMLPHVIQLMMLLKISFAAAIFAYYLKRSFHGKGASVIVFSLFYAWCGFSVCYYWNIMWLDVVAVFPLVALGIEQLVRQGRWKLYTAALAATVLLNFYIAFLVCVFAVIYFLMNLWTFFYQKADKKELIRCCITFAVFSALAGFSMMFVILPTVIGLSQTAVSEVQFPEFAWYRNLYQILSASLAGTRPVVLGQNEDLPNLYSGVLTIILIPCFFGSKKIAWAEKVSYGAALLLLLLCCVLQPLDFLIHGGHFPANLPHRFTFMYTFLLLRMAYTVWEQREPVLIRQWCAIIGGLMFIVLVTEFVVVPRVRELDRIYSDMFLAGNAALMLAYLVCYQMHLKNKLPAAVLMSLVVLECLANGYHSMDRSTSIAMYTKYMDDTKQVVSNLNQRENGNFYRMEFRRFDTTNDASLYHYNGVTQFSSLAPGGISNMLGCLGMTHTGNSYRYYDPTPLLDGILGVRYILNRDQEGSATTVKEHYRLLEQQGNIWVYENPTALPVGFLASEDLLDWKPDQVSPFEAQNQWCELAVRERAVMFTELNQQECRTENIELTGQNGNQMQYRVLEPEILEKIPRATVTFCSDRHQYLYLHIDASNVKRAVYSTGDERQDRELSTGNGLIDVGWVEPGEAITMELEFTDRGEFEKSYRKTGSFCVLAAGYEQAVWENVYAKLSQNVWDLSAWTDTSLEGTVTAGEQTLLFTSIPYIKGWKAQVDGEDCPVTALGDKGVIGVKLEPGTHVVSLQFHVPGLLPGIILSLLDFMILAALWRADSSPLFASDCKYFRLML